MNQTILENSFLEFLQGKGLDIQGLSLKIFPNLFIEYVEKVKFSGFNEENNSDMLLFQYGNYDWGNGKYFEVNFTRQLYEIFADGSHQILQLGITFYYDSETFSNVKSFNKWSWETESLEFFLQTIFDSDGFQNAHLQNSIKKEIFVNFI